MESSSFFTTTCIVIVPVVKIHVQEVPVYKVKVLIIFESQPPICLFSSSPWLGFFSITANILHLIRFISLNFLKAMNESYSVEKNIMLFAKITSDIE